MYAKYSKDGKFTFVWTTDNAISEKFGVEQKPALVVFNSKKGKVAKASEFAVSEVTSILNRALSGDLSYTKLKEDL